MNKSKDRLVVLGAGLGGSIAALELAQSGRDVLLIDRMPRPMLGASRHNEGKLHLGYVYAADPVQKAHGIMSSGSLQFLGIVERLTRVPRQLHTVSDSFTYIVPDDSAMSVDDLWAHVQRVDATAAEHCAAFGHPALPPSSPVPESLLRHHYAERVQAAFATPEIAVDPARVSDIVSAAVYAHPRIAFHGASSVLAAEAQPSGGYRLSLDTGEGRVDMTATGVINALWEDRTRLDEMIGIPAPARWSQRWKATVIIDVPPGQMAMPSTTALVGPYGDFVLYGDRRIYASWYPVCRLSMSTTATPAETLALVARADHETIRRDAISGLATLMPRAAALESYAKTTRIGGGFIMAVGRRDIDVAESGLHERHQIGVECHDTWVSLSTGKFCTAPMFGVEAARALAERVDQ